jgi:hypothetical protein
MVSEYKNLLSVNLKIFILQELPHHKSSTIIVFIHSIDLNSEKDLATALVVTKADRRDGFKKQGAPHQKTSTLNALIHLTDTISHNTKEKELSQKNKKSSDA